MNVNDTVKVKLTEDGHRQYRRHWEAIGLLEEHWRPVKVDEDGWSKFQLWELMQIFGSCFYMGATKMPFRGNMIQVDE